MPQADATLRVPVGLAVVSIRSKALLTQAADDAPRPWYRITTPQARGPVKLVRPRAADDPELDEPDTDPDDDGTVDGDTTLIDIYDRIGGDLWDIPSGVTATDFLAELRKITTPKIRVHINSPGGDIFDAIAIYNGLVQHPAEVHVVIDSLAASAASFVAMAGDRVTAMANAMLMIHDPWGMVIGNAADMREQADLLDKHGDNIARMYAAKAGGTVRSWRKRMQQETWYLAEEAYEAGLVDEIAARDGRPVSNHWDLSVLARQPAPLPAATAGSDSEAAAAPEGQAPPAAPPPADRPAAASLSRPAATSTPQATRDVTQSTQTTTGTRRGRGVPGEAEPWYLPPPRKETPAWATR